MPDTKPLPAAELLRLADDKIRSLQHTLLDIADRTTGEISMAARCAAVYGGEYSQARAASPVTLEEALITDFVSAPKDHNGSSSKFCGALQRLEAHGRVLNSRMLAGEGNTTAPAPGQEGGGNG